MSKDYILSIDNGTQSVRVLVFDRLGNIIDKHKIHLEPYYSTQPGWAEQDVEYYWQSLCQACQNLWAQGRVTPEQIAGFSLTTQRYTMINLDDNMSPLRPAIVWMDQRKACVKEPIAGFLGGLVRLFGQSTLLDSVRANARDRWIMQNQPDIWQKTRYYVNLSTYLTYRLTGQLADSPGSVVGYTPLDYKRQTWSKPSDIKWRLCEFPVKPEMLPNLVPPGGLLGSVSAAASQQTGLTQRLPMFAAASDKACEILGSGVHQPDVACLSYGTTATLNVISERYLEVMPLVPPFPSAIPGKYSIEMMVYRGFWMVSWFKEQFAHLEKTLAADQNVEVEQLFDRLLDQVPPGSMGLMMQPYWNPGVRQPGPEGKGALIGFGDIHNRAHVYRAIVEGLVYELRMGKDKIEKRVRRKINHLKVAGGGSQSDAMMQITADIFAMSVERPHTFEASGLGAAINAAVGLGWYPQHDTAIDAMTRVRDVFVPNETNVALYDRLYKEVYCKMYRRVKPLYQSIRDITGYPT